MNASRTFTVAVMTAGGLLAAGCAVPRGGPAAGNNVCAAVLPAASAVVHDQGRLVLVRPTRRPELVGLFGPQVPSAPGGRSARSTGGPPQQLPPAASPASPENAQPRACLVVYDGHYAAGSVVGTSAPGRYAVIGISVRPVQVLGARTTDTRPPHQLPARDRVLPPRPGRTPAP
jgi:hypothetical protein